MYGGEDAGMQLPASGHDPVLINELLEALAPAEGKTIVDCTLGRAGHALEIARRLGKTRRLIGLDVDPRSLEFARERLMGAAKDKEEIDKNVCPTLETSSAPQCEVRLFHANFAELGDVLGESGVSGVDGIL